MSYFKKTHDLIRQNEKVVTKPHKHDANLQKNSTFYFQVGLILCLLTVYGLLEMKFESKNPSDTAFYLPEDPFDVTIEHVTFKEYVKPKEVVRTQKKVVLVKPPKIIDDEDQLIEDLGIDTPDSQTTTTETFDSGSLVVAAKPEDVNVPINFIQNVPVYPGCEKESSNEGKRKCMSKRISKLIQRKFNGNDIAENYGLRGMQKIDVQFKIDKTGQVTDVITRSPHAELDKEAKRVINFIPTMVPGRQNNKNVGVIYNLPIKFKVE